ncbi:MAG: hypothetical protein KA116_01285 [Proteobacteria bacterium]|nr:hypothetical protein [Pseudomonadota bacterium]
MRFVSLFCFLLLALSSAKVDSKSGGTSGIRPGFEDDESDYISATFHFEKAKEEDSSWFGTKFIVAPITVPIDVAIKLYKGKSLDEVRKEDQNYVIGYVALVYGLGKIQDMHFFQTMEDFHASSDSVSNIKPKNILVITQPGGVSSHNPGETVEYYKKKYKADNIRVLEIESITDLPVEFRRLNLNKIKYDRVDFIIHGTPGKLYFKNDVLHRKNLGILGSINFMSPGAELRLVSCTVGCDLNFMKNSDKFLRELGRVFMPEGGRIVASPKIINSMLNSRHSEIYKKAMSFLNVTGLGGPLRLWLAFNSIDGLFTESLYQKAWNARYIDIPPLNLPNDCPSQFVKLATPQN